MIHGSSSMDMFTLYGPINSPFTNFAFMRKLPSFTKFAFMRNPHVYMPSLQWKYFITCVVEIANQNSQ